MSFGSDNVHIDFFLNPRIHVGTSSSKTIRLTLQNVSRVPQSALQSWLSKRILRMFSEAWELGSTTMNMRGKTLTRNLLVLWVSVLPVFDISQPNSVASRKVTPQSMWESTSESTDEACAFGGDVPVLGLSCSRVVQCCRNGLGHPRYGNMCLTFLFSAGAAHVDHAERDAHGKPIVFEPGLETK
jgi:hypothetical protein